MAIFLKILVRTAIPRFRSAVALQYQSQSPTFLPQSCTASNREFKKHKRFEIGSVFEFLGTVLPTHAFLESGSQLVLSSLLGTGLCIQQQSLCGKV